MIYQLAKTSPLLSGQVRWDMCLSYGTSNPEVSSLHIVPLSDRIIYNENGRKTFNYSHAENVKHLYKQTESEFYSTLGLRDTTYYVYNGGIIQDPFDHTYEMGWRRMRYERYNKQFSFLCPVWISEELDYDKLYFEITIEDADPSTPNNTRIVNYINKIYLSDQMKSYISDYMAKNASGKPINDELINFKFEPVSAYITGLQVDSAKCSVRDVTYVLRNLIDRERPLLEFDDMIASLFSQKHIIAQQLINFNLIFNLEDICPETTAHSIHYHDMNIKIRVGYDDKLIELKDLYSNYSNIPSYNISTDDYDDTQNVFDYLQDDKCKDLVYVNKTTQPIFHWALLENPNIIFNVYDGFAPSYTKRDGALEKVAGRYYNQCDIRIRQYDKKTSNLEWCKHYELTNSNQWPDILDLSNIIDNFTIFKFKQDICWFSSNKYDLTNTDIDNKDIGFMTIQLANEYQAPILSCVTIPSITEPSAPTYIVHNIVDGIETYAIASISNHNLTMASICDVFKSYMTDPNHQSSPISDLCEYFVTMFSHWEAPYKIEFFKSLSYQQVAFDGGYTDVIKYFKKDASHYSYVYRYTGKIIPYFIDVDHKSLYSLNYYYKQWTDANDEILQMSEYNRLLRLGYMPEYPIKSGTERYEIDPKSFYSLIPCKFTSKQDDWYNDWSGDITWMLDSRIWDLPVNIDISHTVLNYLDKSDEEIQEELWDKMYDWFGNNGSNSMRASLHNTSNKPWCMSYLKSKYKMTITSAEYAALNNIKDINYIVKFKLA